MGFLKKFGISFNNKKNKLLPESSIEPTIFSQTDFNAFKTLATFDLKVESPKYDGAIPEATIKFYPLK